MENRQCPTPYIWREGDDLERIAQQHGTQSQLIQGANPHIDFNRIEPGTEICVPDNAIVIIEDELIAPESFPAPGFGSMDLPANELDPGFSGPRPTVCAGGARSYTWLMGDSLSRVALEYGVTQQQLRSANPDIDFSVLSAGSTICIPARQPQCTDGTLHIVRSGDTITSIARAHGVTAGAVMDRNPYVDPNRLQIGMLICVPPRPQPAPTPIPTPPAPAPTPSPCPPGYAQGYVRYGETFGDILLRYNISYQAFALSNPQLNMDLLIPAQRYCVPPMGSRGLCPPGANSEVVGQNENLLTLAARLHTTPAALLKLNQNLAPADFVTGRVICR